MIIWRLQINQVESTPSVVISSFRAKRHLSREEFFQSKEGAEKRRDEIYDGVKKLLGFIEQMEVVLTEVEVKP